MQLHGVASRRPEFIRSLKDGRELKIFLVLQAGEVSDFEASGHNRGDIGAPSSSIPVRHNSRAATGKTFDWRAAAAGVEAIKANSNLVVAGGLNSSNVTEAIRILKPWGVDVASGVEARPGKKDPEKIRAFIEAVRNS